MDADKLEELAGKISALLDEYGIDSMMFTLGVRVTPQYYQTIKNNFPERHEVDLIVGVSRENWNINLICSVLD